MAAAAYLVYQGEVRARGRPRADPAAPGCSLQATRESGDYASFEWIDGAIAVRAPDEATLRRMLELAELLDAVVQGDDSEEYEITVDGRDVPTEA